MNRNTMMFALVAVALCAVGANAQGQAAAPASDNGQAAAPAAPTAKNAKKIAWENGVKKDCSAEIADGGVCAGKDFGTGLEKCLHENRAKLSDGCKATVHRHHKKPAAQTGAAPAEGAPASAPAPDATQK